MSSRLAAAALAALAAATVGAFFLTQRLKQSPAVVQAVRLSSLFSPNGDGRRDTATLSFRLKRADDVTVGVLDRRGDVVRTLLSNRSLPARARVHLRWGGVTDDHALAPDGLYRYRVNLRHEGRSVLVPRSVRLDDTPPHPVVTSVKPDIFPSSGFGGIRVRYSGPKRRPAQFTVYATDRSPPRVVARFAGRAGSAVTTWDARDATGAQLPPGTYLVAVAVRDRAGNLGTAPATLPPRPGEISGHPGFTVRTLAAQAPAAPVAAGAVTTFLVDARGHPYEWSIRRAGAGRALKSGVKHAFALTVHAPTGASGLYVLALRRGQDAIRVPFAVQARRRANVLVVLPYATWQGLNALDQGPARPLAAGQDGFPNTLLTGEPVPVTRPFSALPAGIASTTAPLLAYLDHAGLRYDIATDVQLAGPGGPALLNRRPGVVLAGSARWMPQLAGERLRAWVRTGGHVATVGVDSLRRQVSLIGDALVRPTAPAARDIFGAVVSPVVHRRVDLLNFGQDRIALFADTGGGFAGFGAYEVTRSVPGGRVVAAAGPAEGTAVILAYRLGRGLVFRFGLPALPQRLASDSDAAALMRRTWTLLSR